jgi:hypothetical protein
MNHEPVALSDTQLQESEDTEHLSKTEFLKKRLRFHINEYKEKRNNSRRQTKAFKLINIVLGALITFFLAIKTSAIFKDYADVDPILSNIALLFSTLVTALTAWDTFADYRGKWIRSRSVLVTLYNIRDDLRYTLAGDGKPLEAVISEFYERLKLALNETNEEWMSNRGNALSGAPARAGTSE